MKTTKPLLFFLVLIVLGSCKWLCPVTETLENECTLPLGLITKEKANEMEELYKIVGWNAINDSLSSSGQDIEDTRESWLSLQEMKDYICYFEDAAETLGYDSLGLRIYFGAKLDTLASQDTLLAYRSTCFIWPTYVPEPESNSIAFDPIGNDDDDPNKNADGIKGLDYFGMGKKEFIYP